MPAAPLSAGNGHSSLVLGHSLGFGYLVIGASSKRKSLPAARSLDVGAVMNESPGKSKEAAMRATIVKLMTVVLIASAAPLAQAHDPIHAQQVETWYQRYLGRAAEPF